MNTSNAVEHCPRDTPWGHADGQRKVADGIWSVSTPGHGGYYVSAARLEQMHPVLRGFKTWAGEGWYEEDCDWAIVVLAFPELFTERDRFYAVRTVSGSGDYFNGFWRQFSVTPEGQKLKAQFDAFWQANQTRFEIGGYGSPPDGEKGWFVSAIRLDGKQRATWAQDEHPGYSMPFTIEEIKNPRQLKVVEL